MRDVEILNANLLDIIFENRNKSYGAYALRKFYPRRLTKSVSVALGLVLFLFLLTLSASKKQVIDTPTQKPDVQLVEIVVPPPKPVEPPPPTEQPRAATIASTDKIVFTNITNVAPQSEINNKLVSTITYDHPKLSSTQPTQITQPATETTSPVQANAPAGITCDAAYPGGREKFAEFLKTKLSTPEDLAAGQKQKVLVRFKVDVDGSISQIEVIESGGVKFDNEVIRVMKKMPKWSPAMQNGMKVSSYFIQVVTFIGEEQ